jgi:hypothetical protein
MVVTDARLPAPGQWQAAAMERRRTARRLMTGIAEQPPSPQMDCCSEYHVMAENKRKTKKWLLSY